MTIQVWTLIILFVGILLALTKPMGLWLHGLYEGRRTPLHSVLGPIERGFYRLSGVDPTAGRLNAFRRIATRYDKLARNFLSAVHLAAAIAFWL